MRGKAIVKRFNQKPSKSTSVNLLYIVAVFYFFLFIADNVHAQHRIEGTVKDNGGQSITGANVYLLDTYDGGATGPDGSFGFGTEKSGDQILVVSAVGYQIHQETVDLSQRVLSFEIILHEETKRLDDLVITAGLFEASDEKKAVILKPLDIVTTAGATADIPGVLNTLPGTQTVGETGRLFVRGGSDNETRNFIDGMLVSQPYGLSPANIPSRMRFSPFLFSGTTFSTGGYSAEFGQALSGILNLGTDDEALQTQTDLSLMSVGGGVAHTQKWKKSSIFFETFYSDLTPYFWLVPQNTDWNRAPLSWQNTMMFRQKIGNNGMLKLFYSGEWSKMDLYQPSRIDVTEYMKVNLTNQYHYVNANYEGMAGKSWLIGTGFSQTWSEQGTDLDDLGIEDRLNNLHFKFSALFDKGGFANLKLGTDVFRYRYGNNTKIYPEDETSIQEVDDLIPAVFLESKMYLSDHFIAVLGGRWEYSGLSGKSILSPRISLAYKAGTYTQISFASGRYHQRPENKYLIINDDLKDENAFHYILNFQYVKEQRTFRAEAYYKDYRDLVAVQQNRVPDYGYLSGETLEMQTAYEGTNLSNSGYGYAGGLDIFWRDSQTLRNVDYWLSYSFLDTKRLYQDFPEKATPAFASKHNFSFVYKQFIQAIRSQVGLTYSFASSRPYNDPNSNRFNDGRTPAYHDLSMNLSYLVRTNIIIHFSVTNVLGRDNVFGYQYSLVPDENGNFTGIPIGQPAKRFIFLGMFITLTRDKKANQLRNL